MGEARGFDSVAGIRRMLFCPMLVLMLTGFGCGGGGSNSVITDQHDRNADQKPDRCNSGEPQLRQRLRNLHRARRTDVWPTCFRAESSRPMAVPGRISPPPLKLRRPIPQLTNWRRLRPGRFPRCPGPDSDWPCGWLPGSLRRPCWCPIPGWTRPRRSCCSSAARPIQLQPRYAPRIRMRRCNVWVKNFDTRYPADPT